MEMACCWLETDTGEPGWLDVDPGVPAWEVAEQATFTGKVGFKSHCKGWRKAA